ncbi:ANKRD50, partial [Symbiodinium natans]
MALASTQMASPLLAEDASGAQQGQTFAFRVEGMKCNSCARKIRAALQALQWPSIADIVVEVPKDFVQVHVADVAERPAAASAAIVSAIEALGMVVSEWTGEAASASREGAQPADVGHEPAVEVDYEVLGMKCGSCVSK